MTRERFIVGTSGTYHPGRRCDVEYGPLAAYAVELAGVEGRAPKIGYLATACGDQKARIAERMEAARLRGWQLNPLTCFMMPNVDDPREYLLDQDVIWVDGGSVVNLLAVWRAHGLDEVMREAWEKGIVLAGVLYDRQCASTGQGKRTGFSSTGQGKRPLLPRLTIQDPHNSAGKSLSLISVQSESSAHTLTG